MRCQLSCYAPGQMFESSCFVGENVENAIGALFEMYCEPCSRIGFVVDDSFSVAKELLNVFLITTLSP